MFTRLTSLTISVCWEQAGSGGSGIAGRGETGFAESKLVAVDVTGVLPLTYSCILGTVYKILIHGCSSYRNANAYFQTK